MLNESDNIYIKIFILSQILFSILAIGYFPGTTYGFAKIDSGMVDIGNFYQGGGQAVPGGWKLIRYKGEPALKIVPDGQQSFLRLTCSGQTAFGIRKDVAIDVRNHPYLHWNWQALRLPEGGDIRLANQDDQALQIYLVFPGTGLLDVHNGPTIAYIWDNEAPKGLKIRSPQPALSNVRYIVLKNKSDTLGKWYQETRNVLEDYRKLFPEINHGEPVGSIRSILLFINTHHTKSNAEGAIGYIYFTLADKCQER